MENPLPVLEAPGISVAVNYSMATVKISPVEGAIYYEMSINGNHVSDGRYDTITTTITITDDMLNVGENTIIVRAYNHVVFSPDSNTIVVGKLSTPEDYILATGTGVEFPWGDVENAQGYNIYDEDGKYLATIGLGESYDFSSIYTEDGFYFPSIQAYGDGWISSDLCGIPVSIGSNRGPIGN